MIEKPYGFENLDVWKMARKVNQMVYEEIISRPEIKDYPLKDQINRSAGSIMDNIAEGQGRGGNKEFIQFLYVARGSLKETQSQLFRASDREYLSVEKFNVIMQLTHDLLKKLNGLVHYLKHSNMSGNKFDKSDQYRI